MQCKISLGTMQLCKCHIFCEPFVMGMTQWLIKNNDVLMSLE
jgi:hypothetical protein